MAAYSYAPLQPLDGTSAASLRKHEESSLLLGTYAAHSSGLVNGVSLDWSVNGGAADHACGEAECHAVLGKRILARESSFARRIGREVAAR